MKTRYFFTATSVALSFACSQGVRASDTCYPQVIVPAAYSNATESVQVYEASPTYTSTPPQMGHGERKIKIADAYVEYTIIPAQFKEVTETVETERERVEIETLPATYRTETKRVKTREATQRWNPACPPVLEKDASAVPAHCLLEVPAEYTEVTREVVDVPVRTVKKIIPGKTQTITRNVLVEPAKVVAKTIPAEYTSIPLARVEQAPKLTTTQNASRYTAVATQQKIRPEKVLPRPAVCEENFGHDDILRLQQHLQQEGNYYAGEPDGALGPKTRAALTHFQEDHGLAAGAITLETMQKLGIQ
jgi:hypothetical protein